MKLFILLLLFSGISNAEINKCIVNGKTLYQQTPCPTIKSKRTMSNKTFSGNFSTDGLRAVIAKEKLAKNKVIEDRKKYLASPQSTIDSINGQVAAQKAAMNAKMAAQQAQIRMQMRHEINSLKTQMLFNQ